FPSLERLSSLVLEAVIRKNSDSLKDPACPDCSALSGDQLSKSTALRDHVSKLP
ncbi:Uncharacterized protein FKW44_019235, partial [Caligus rogercresseyi]